MVPSQILDFLEHQQVGVLAVEMPDGSPHGATVHYAHSAQPFLFYFETNPEYRKSEALRARPKSRATFVVGTHVTSRQTLQLDGEVSLVPSEREQDFHDVYFGKFPDVKGKLDTPHLYFTFTPTWWRFTDWDAPADQKIISSAS